MSVRPWRTAISGFTSIRPVIVDVAVPVKSVPFWIADQGFRRRICRSRTATRRGASIGSRLSQGWIGLGVNGLDRTPVGPLRRVRHGRWTVGKPAVLDPNVSARSTTFAFVDDAGSLQPGVSAAHDAYKPFQALPSDLVDAVLLQPAHARAAFGAAGHGPCLEDPRRLELHPDQVTIAFGSDPARELVWTWRTSAESASTAIRVARLPKVVEDKPSTGADDSPRTRSGS